MQRRSVGLLVGLVIAIATGFGLQFGHSAAAQPVRGVFGVTVAIQSEGLFDPTIASARIVGVDPDLPAHKAGVTVGDEVLEVDGRRIPGARARDLAPLSAGKRMGETIALRLQRPDGQVYAVRLVAAARPSR